MYRKKWSLAWPLWPLSMSCMRANQNGVWPVKMRSFVWPLCERCEKGLYRFRWGVSPFIRLLLLLLLIWRMRRRWSATATKFSVSYKLVGAEISSIPLDCLIYLIFRHWNWFSVDPMKKYSAMHSAGTRTRRDIATHGNFNSHSVLIVSGQVAQIHCDYHSHLTRGRTLMNIQWIKRFYQMSRHMLSDWIRLNTHRSFESTNWRRSKWLSQSSTNH